MWGSPEGLEMDDFEPDVGLLEKCTGAVVEQAEKCVRKP